MRLYAEIVVFAALAALLWLADSRIASLRLQLAAAESAALQERITFSALRNADTREAALTRENENETNRLRARSLSATSDRLQQSLQDYAVRAGSAAAVAASCDQRAAALGRGLAATLRAEEELVEDLELQRSDTRVLLEYSGAGKGVKQ